MDKDDEASLASDLLMRLGIPVDLTGCDHERPDFVFYLAGKETGLEVTRGDPETIRRLHKLSESGIIDGSMNVSNLSRGSTGRPSTPELIREASSLNAAAGLPDKEWREKVKRIISHKNGRP